MVDANILYAGATWKRWPYEVLRHAAQKDFRLVLCQQVIDEASENYLLDYPQNEGRFRRFLKRLHYELADDPTPKQVARYKDLLPDPDDVAIAVAAIYAGVDYFVSEDKHFTTKDERRRELHSKLNIMLSGTFLREVMGWTSEELEKVRGRT